MFGRFYANKTWRQWLDFLKWLRGRYHASETLHVVLDNFGPHLKQEVLPRGKTHNINMNLPK